MPAGPTAPLPARRAPLSWVWAAILAIDHVLAAAAILYVLRRPWEARTMLAWILALLLLPGLGLALFLVFGEPRRLRHLRRRRRLKLRSPARPRGGPEAVDPGPAGRAVAAGGSDLELLARRLGAAPALDGNEVTIYHDAPATFDAIRASIAAARSHVHLEYYILQPDETGKELAELLARKALEGVPCRLLLDYIGSWRLSRSFLAPMRRAGVEIVFALPVFPFKGRWRANYRNHRKIAVIDGRVGYTGSQNIGDEYRGRRHHCGPWRDTHLRLTGPCVADLQDVFVQDWHYSTRVDLRRDELYPRLERAGDHVVQMVPSGPDQRSAVLHHLLFAAVSTARSTIRVITPYFVPDGSMVLAFQSARYRGVKVQLLVPTRSDHRIVLWAGRSFYDELVGAGVEVYEHDDCMLHSKVVVVDKSWAMVGSANMDERSFRLNFELTTLLYSPELATELFDDFERLAAKSRRITREDISSRSFVESIVLGLARLTAPLL